MTEPSSRSEDEGPPLQIQSWAIPFLESPLRWNIAEGGRGSGKSYMLTAIIMYLASQKPQRVLFARETLESLEESSMALIKELIATYKGFAEFYTTTKGEVFGRNGSKFFFRGLSATHGTAGRVRGIQGINLVMLEEAQTISQESYDNLMPTVRAKGSKLFAALNPRYDGDPVWKEARSGDSGVRTAMVNYMDNPFWTEEQERERQRCQEVTPEQYPHVYEGALDTEGTGLWQILSYGLAQDCRDAWQPSYAEGQVHIGYDCADSGDDWNVVVARKGPSVVALDRWTGKGSTVAHSVRRALAFAREYTPARLFYDAGGTVGGAVSDELRKHDLPFQVEGLQFGGPAAGAGTFYVEKRRNKDQFRNRGAQMGQNLRMRADKTRALMARELVSPADCLFISPQISNMADYFAELSQPTWDDHTGKMIIRKRPGRKQKSPDRYDATALAFAEDSRYGLSHAKPTEGWTEIYG